MKKFKNLNVDISKYNEHKKFITIKGSTKHKSSHKRINKKISSNSYKILIKACLVILILFIVYFSLKFTLKLFWNNNNNIKYDKHDKYKKYKERVNDNSTCSLLDPINVYNLRLKNEPVEICIGKNTKNICYINHQGYYNDIFAVKNGSICIIENIVIDPSKAQKSGLVYKGPVDSKHFGDPIISKGFLNTKCTPQKVNCEINKLYTYFFDTWNYDYDIENENEELEELAPGKTVFLMGRNQDSPNLFHGTAEMINVISILYLFNLAPEDVKIVFMESVEIPQDPFLDIYKNVISRGGEAVHITSLKKKYKISKAINIPQNWDSPVFIYVDIPQCNTSAIAYQLYNDLVDKYMNLKPFQDTFVSDNISLYYPDKVIQNNKNNIKFKKMVTIQWRRVWPEGRTGQQRIIGNGPQLADKLASILPDDILVRLINTASLPIKDQISVMRSTDYLIGIHGAGLSLSLFLPQKSIYHEILHGKNIPVLALISALSGHITYRDILKATTNRIDGNENVFFDENNFGDSVLGHMKENNFFN